MLFIARYCFSVFVLYFQASLNKSSFVLMLDFSSTVNRNKQ